MARHWVRSVVSAILAILSMSFFHPAVFAQHDHDSAPPALPKSFEESMPLYSKALGTFTRPMSSRNKEAQAYFDQGFQLKYAFDSREAARSFREAWKRDPDCAICYWGEAWAWSSDLNNPAQCISAPFAHAAIQKAQELASRHASPVEQALIEAMGNRCGEKLDREGQPTRNAAFAEAMRKVYEKFPKDLDVATLYAEALFVQEPRRGTRDISKPNIQRLMKVLEDVLAADRHAGACHIYIHVTEATSEPGRAEACAEWVGNAIPGASHMNHMPSHTWSQIGRWGDAVRANIQAWHSDQKAAIGEGFAIYTSHNLHMLAFAASMDGQGALAIQAARDYAKLPRSNNILEVLALIRFGRFDEVLQIPDPPKPSEGSLSSEVWNFGQGYARLRKGGIPFAKAHLLRVLHSAATSETAFRFHTAHDFLGTLAGILEGEIYRSEGNLTKAIESFERAASLEDAMIWDEPEPLPFAARHWLGAALLEAKRFANAERVYREDLEKHPHNGWALFGLREALEGQGKAAVDIAKEFESSWERSDTWIRGSRF
ncbi:MAG: tetratricopeptide repeat protein [Candidatus Korobacteraceae bacterium]